MITSTLSLFIIVIVLKQSCCLLAILAELLFTIYASSCYFKDPQFFVVVDDIEMSFPQD